MNGSRLLGPADIRQIAARLDLRPAKRLGQNFVIDPGTVRRIVALAGVRPDDHVLEAGPGLGSLTLALLAACRRVLAIEVDPVLAAELPRTVASVAPEAAGRLQVVTADAARITGLPGVPGDEPERRGGARPEAGASPEARGLPEGGVPPPRLLVANLPYSAAVPVLLNLLAVVPSLASGVVMVQAEVAERMTAPPGSRIYGVPSAKLAWFAEARRAGQVPRSVFWPVPRVDSGLVAFARHDPPPPTHLAAEVTREQVFEVIDAAFAQRRKMLRSALAPWAGSAAEAERILRAAGLDPSARGESLGVAGFAAIAAARAR